MRRNWVEWVSFSLTVIGWSLAVLVSVGLLNFTGDCKVDTGDCNEIPRRISFLVFAFGFLGPGYYIFRFVRGPNRR